MIKDLVMIKDLFLKSYGNMGIILHEKLTGKQ